MATPISDQQKVNNFIQKLEPEFATMVETIRQIILITDPIIAEQIKWNSPSFYYSGEMKDFDPKTYKRDLVVVNCRKNIALLVFPTGNVIKNGHGILEGDYKDGRRMVTFKNIAEIKSKSKALQEVIKEWLKVVDK